MDVLIFAGLLGLGLITGYLLGTRKGAGTGALLAARTEEIAALQTQLSEARQSVITTSNELSRTESDYANLAERWEDQKKELENLRAQFLEQFRSVSNQVLVENSEHFRRSSSENLERLLLPLRERIKEFEQKVDSTYEKNLRDNISLREQITQLANLNQQISQDAINLTRALKGDSKTQGNWGEYLLENLLDKSGLQRGIHYNREEVKQNEDGKTYRPDVIVMLPDEKHLIIDSKVSLVAYENYCSCEDPDQQKAFLLQHINSLKTHYTELGRKNYQQLTGINSPDFVLMFIPVEPAFNLAMQHDRQLFLDALDRNIVFVTTSTLLATLRTVSGVWQQENQKRNVLRIAEESGKLYDKFAAFVDDLQDIGQHLERTQTRYNAAMNKLSQGKGNILRRVENLKQLGAKTSKKIDPAIGQQFLSENPEPEETKKAETG